jgi:hypothetical protein
MWYGVGNGPKDICTTHGEKSLTRHETAKGTAIDDIVIRSEGNVAT